MSAWVHVAGIVRIDMFRFPEEGENDEKEIIELMTNTFGKELSFYDRTYKWEDASKHPEYGFRLHDRSRICRSGSRRCIRWL